jgi:hypothetical protein
MEVLLSDRTLEFLVSTQNLEPETLFGRVLNDDTLSRLQMLIYFGGFGGCLILML